MNPNLCEAMLRPCDKLRGGGDNNYEETTEAEAMKFLASHTEKTH